MLEISYVNHEKVSVFPSTLFLRQCAFSPLNCAIDVARSQRRREATSSRSVHLGGEEGPINLLSKVDGGGGGRGN